MKRGIEFWLVCVVGCWILTSGCQDYNVPIAPVNTGTSPGGTVTITQGGIVFVDIGRTRQLTVTISADPGNQGVTWALSGPGTLSNITTTSAVYTASMTSGDTAVVSATGVAHPTEIASSSIFMVPLPTITAATLPGGTVGSTYSAAVNATGGAVPYIWNVATGSMPPGVSFSVSSLTSITLSGAPTCPGGVPSCTAQTYNFTLQVSDITGAIAKQAFSIAVAGTSSAPTGNAAILKTLAGDGSGNSLMQGDYAFRFGGFNSHGMTAAAGSFSADGNGNIVGGLMDRTNAASGAQRGLTLAGTYSIGANHLGVMNLSFADGTNATYAMAISADGSARFIQFDATAVAGTNGAGDMKKQDATSVATLKVAGNYVFQFAGVDSNGSRMATAGAFTVSDSGVMSAGVADVNDSGAVANATLNGNFAQSTSGARTAEFDFDPKANSGIASGHFSLYPVSADEMFAVQTDASGQPLMIGSILRQNAAAFTSSSFSGSEVVQATGFSAGETQMIFGMLNVNAAGAAVLSAAQLSGSDVGEINSNYSSSVSGNGRVSLGSASGAPIVYLVRPNAGFVLGTDASVMVGWMQAPGTGTISVSSFNGTISGASVFPAGPGMTQSVVSFAFDGKGNVSGTGATSGPDGQTLLPILQGTYTVGSGDIFMSVTWPLQSPQPMLIVSSGKLIVVPPSAIYAPVAVQQ